MELRTGRPCLTHGQLDRVSLSDIRRLHLGFHHEMFVRQQHTTHALHVSNRTPRVCVNITASRSSVVERQGWSFMSYLYLLDSLTNV